MTPLMMIAGWEEQYLPFVKKLLNRGADVTRNTSLGILCYSRRIIALGDTALTNACRSGHLATVAVLLTRGASVDHQKTVR